ncbi:MAG: antibiotic biosynthesis monooxygenase [Saccharothrix sp.]|nr:antibiotic biosynthesis monooxygenase [Saccharothrix sp.]
MILEVATLDVRPGQEADFEQAFQEARGIVARSPGFLSLDLRRSVERPSRYLLLIGWERLEDHTVGFRQGPLYPRWKALLHHFYDPFPTVEHYRAP